MISATLQGGLGNVMFQVAATHALALDNGDQCAFNHHTPSLQGSPTTAYASNILRKVKFFQEDAFYPAKIYTEPHFHFSRLPYHPQLLIKGYFQSEKYFAHHKNEIKALFDATHEMKKYVVQKYPFIHSQQSIGVHVRRGDYLNFPSKHPLCTIQYYSSALQSFGDLESYKVLVFSDDPAWCRDHFSRCAQVITGNTAYQDLYLMSLCSHNIIANSSFSWWAAWLNSHPQKKIIAPKTIFGPALSAIDTSDVHPEGWLKL